MTTIYADTSAWGKLVKDEPESEALAGYVDARLDAGDDFVSSALIVTEMGRLAERFDIDRGLVADVLDQVNIFTPDLSIYRAAGRLAGSDLRSLDALHLAQCLALDADLLTSYDERQLATARALGIRTISPGIAGRG
jgi:predicted nucleic acid-binding protein